MDSATAQSRRPPPGTVQSSSNDPLGRGDTPRSGPELPPCMEMDWKREYEAMARTLRQAQVHAADGSGSPPSEDEWNQVLGAIAWAAAIPQLDRS
eukprot:8381638-Pyramimonas_sp.AAC.1